MSIMGEAKDITFHYKYAYSMSIHTNMKNLTVFLHRNYPIDLTKLPIVIIIIEIQKYKFNCRLSALS